jgi:hypothetical protein
MAFGSYKGMDRQDGQAPPELDTAGRLSEARRQLERAHESLAREVGAWCTDPPHAKNS